MKNILLTFFLLLGGITIHGQKIKKIIDKGNALKLETYISKGEDINLNIDKSLYFEAEDTNIVYSIHPMVYATGSGNSEIVELFIKYKDKINNYDEVLVLSL